MFLHKKDFICSLAVLILSCGILFGVKYFYIKGKVARLDGCKHHVPHLSQLAGFSKDMRVVLLGDSRMQYWGNPIFGKQIETINLGSAGATSSEVLCLITQENIQIKADFFIVQVGINDIVAASMQSQDLRNQTIKNLMENIKKIILQLKKNNSRVIILTLVPPISPDVMRTFIWGSEIDEAIEKISKEIVDEFSKTDFVFEMRQLFFDHEHSRWRKQYTTDSLHWSQEGYGRLTHEIKKILERSIRDEKKY